MAAIRLETRVAQKPWGRRTLWPGFADVAEGAPPVGEIWFVDNRAEAPPLLVKYLFTSEKLSVQVHPDDERARALGQSCGKDEAWLILDAEPHSTIGLGLREVMSREDLRERALDGSIEDELAWQAVKPGDFFYSPGGTIHAIGEGITLVEIQQNVDLTYRLYDYGRPRELHLEQGVEVSDPVPYVVPFVPLEASAGRLILADGPAFVVERWARSGEGVLKSGDRPVWLIPLKCAGTIDGQPLAPGSVWVVEGEAHLSLGTGADLLLAYPGRGIIPDIWE